MIPKVIHYCWFGEEQLPREVKKCINTWKKLAPDFVIKEWNESNIDVSSHPFMEEAYNEKAWAFVSDYARLKVIYENGGIYLDTDVELLKSIEKLLEYDFFIGRQQGGHPTTGLGYGAKKNSKIVLNMMKEYDKISFLSCDKSKIACPLLNSKVIYKLGYETSENIWEKDNVAVFPSRFFDPIAQGNTRNLLCDDTYSIHHYTGSWTSKGNRIKRHIFRLIGEEKIHRIKKIVGKAK